MRLVFQIFNHARRRFEMLRIRAQGSHLHPDLFAMKFNSFSCLARSRMRLESSRDLRYRRAKDSNIEGFFCERKMCITTLFWMRMVNSTTLCSKVASGARDLDSSHLCLRTKIAFANLVDPGITLMNQSSRSRNPYTNRYMTCCYLSVSAS